MSARNSYRKIGLTNGYKTTNLLASPSLATSYNLTLPPTLPTATGQSLISDLSGTLAWGLSTGTLSTFTSTTNPVSTPTNITGLQFITSYTTLSVYVVVNATSNIYAMYSLHGYQKGSSSSWGLSYTVNGDTDDDPSVIFSITTTGQVQYTMGTVTGFTSLSLMWTLGTAVSNTLTSLALSSQLSVGGTSSFTGNIQGTTLALSSSLNVTGTSIFTGLIGAVSLALGSLAKSGTITSPAAPFLVVQGQTFTDTVTAASSSAGGTFSGSFLGIPTLTASNTSVTTPTASTLVVAGSPIAGTNQTITNSYAINVQSGDSLFNGLITTTGQTYARMSVNSSLSISNVNTTPIKCQNFSFGGALFYNSTTGLVTVVATGAYVISCLLSISNGASSAITGTVYIVINGTVTAPNLATSYLNVFQFVGSQVIYLNAGSNIGISFNNAVTLDVNTNWCIYRLT